MFEDISVGIKTFLRDDKLFRAIDGVRRNLPGAQLIIADDGVLGDKKYNLYTELQREGHIVEHTAFDIGFGAKSNLIADRLTRPYLLTGSDDFDFTPEAVAGVKLLQGMLDASGDLDVTSGRVNNRPYEFFLDIKGNTVKERLAEVDYKVMGIRPRAYIVDLTVNYSLIRRKVFWTPVFGVLDKDGKQTNGEMRNKLRWDDDVKIGGGEHGAFFIDLKWSGFHVGFVPGANIEEQPGQDSERYREFRNRARAKERPCFDRRGIKKYILGDGTIDYDATGSR